MAKAFDCAPKKKTPWRLEGRQGWSVIDAPSTRLSLVGLRPRTPDSVSPGTVTIRESCFGGKRSWNRKHRPRRGKDVTTQENA